MPSLMYPRPNIRKEALDLFSLERQVGGIEPGEYLNLKAKRFARSRREMVGVFFLFVIIALLCAIWLWCLYRAMVTILGGEA